MYVVEPMMGRGDRHDLRSSSHRLDAEAFLKVAHKVGDASTGGRHVSSHFHILFRTSPPRTGCHLKFAPVCLDKKHGLRSVAIEFTVKPQNEFFRGRWRKFTLISHAINFSLHAHVCSRLKLQTTAPLVFVEFSGKGALDVSGPSVMTFYEIAVVGIHHPYKIGQIGRRARMQRFAERG